MNTMKSINIDKKTIKRLKVAQKIKKLSHVLIEEVQTEVTIGLDDAKEEEVTSDERLPVNIGTANVVTSDP